MTSVYEPQRRPAAQPLGKHFPSPSFHVEKELATWTKTANTSSLINNYSAIELVQIYVESQVNAQYALPEGATSLLKQTIIERFEHFDVNHPNAQGLTKLTLDQLTCMAFHCYRCPGNSGFYKCLAHSITEKFQNEKAALECASFEKIALLLACLQNEPFLFANELFKLIKEKRDFIYFEKLSQKEQLFLFVFLHSKKHEDLPFFDHLFKRFTDLPQFHSAPFVKLSFNNALDLILALPKDTPYLQPLILLLEKVFVKVIQTYPTVQYDFKPFSGVELEKLVKVVTRTNRLKQSPFASAIIEELLSQNAKKIKECLQGDTSNLFALFFSLTELSEQTAPPITSNLIIAFEEYFQSNFILENVSTTHLLLSISIYLVLEIYAKSGFPNIYFRPTNRPFFTTLTQHLVKSHTWEIQNSTSKEAFFKALNAIGSFSLQQSTFALKNELLELSAGILLSSESLLQECSNANLVICFRAFAQCKKDHEAIFYQLEEIFLQKRDKSIGANWAVLQNLLTLSHTFHCFSSRMYDVLIQYSVSHGIVAFEYVCRMSDTELALALLRKGLDTNKTTENRCTPLFVAVFCNLKQVVIELLQRTASDINKTSILGNTPLHIAVRHLDIPLTKLLLAHGADATKCTAEGKLTPFCLMLENFHAQPEAKKLEIIQFYSHIFQGFDQVITYLQQTDYTSLLLFFETSPEAGKFKEGFNSDGEAINPFEAVYFMQSVSFAKKVCKQFTLIKGLEYLTNLVKKYPQATDWMASVLFREACREKNEGGALLLVEQMSLKELNRCRALTVAIDHSLFQVMNKLLHKKVDVNLRNSKQQTALHIVCSNGLKEAAHLLMQHGAALDIQTQNGNSAFQLALKSMLWSTAPQKIKAFFAHFLKDFPHLLKRIEQHQGKNLSEYFSTYPELLIEEPHVRHGVNPLFVPFLFNDQAIAKALFMKIGQTGYHKLCRRLRAEYPAANLDSIEFAGYELDKQHLTQKVQEDVPDKPPGATLDELLDFFKEVNFYDRKKAPYFDPEIYGFLQVTNSTFAEQLSKGFVNVIKERQVTMIPSGTEARNKFYRDVENMLCHTIRAAKTAVQKAVLLSKCMKLIDVCAGGILPVCMNLYNDYVKGMPETFEQALFDQLGDYRKMIVESLLPANIQNTHYFLMLFYQLSKKERLNLPYSKVAYDDRVAAPDAVDVAATETIFFTKKYRAQDIVPYVEQQIIQNGEFRNRYIDYWKKKLPNTWQEVVYDDLETATLNRELIAKALEQEKVIAVGKSLKTHSKGFSLPSWLVSWLPT